MRPGHEGSGKRCSTTCETLGVHAQSCTHCIGSFACWAGGIFAFCSSLFGRRPRSGACSVGCASQEQT